jgi:phage terminase large subunit-like protein
MSLTIDPPVRAGVAAGIGYAEDVVGGRIVACHYTKLACERFLRDLEAANAGTSPWEFQPDSAEAPIILAGALPNIKGPETGKPLRLMPWQRFIFCNLFGFASRKTGARRFRQGTIWAPRGNGKTSIAAPLALYLSFLDGEGSARLRRRGTTGSGTPPVRHRP